MGRTELEQIEKQLADKATKGDVFAYIKHEDTPKGRAAGGFSAGEVKSAVRDTSELLAEAVNNFADTRGVPSPAIFAQRPPANIGRQLSAPAICFT